MIAAAYRAPADPHGVVHLPSRYRALVKCGRLRARLEPTTIDRFDAVCKECAGTARHDLKHRRSA